MGPLRARVLRSQKLHHGKGGGLIWSISEGVAQLAGDPY